MEREVVECCASCKFWQVWFDNMSCKFDDETIKPYEKCSKYESRFVI